MKINDSGHTFCRLTPIPVALLPLAPWPATLDSKHDADDERDDRHGAGRNKPRRSLRIAGLCSVGGIRIRLFLVGLCRTGALLIVCSSRAFSQYRLVGRSWPFACDGRQSGLLRVLLRVSR